MCHNVVELVKSNTKYCCRQPDIVGDNTQPPLKFYKARTCRQPDIVGDNNHLTLLKKFSGPLCRQPDIVGDNNK